MENSPALSRYSEISTLVTLVPREPRAKNYFSGTRLSEDKDEERESTKSYNGKILRNNATTTPTVLPRRPKSSEKVMTGAASELNNDFRMA
jgi:hypothetical protein